MDIRRSTLYWGKLSVSRSITHKVEIVTYEASALGRSSTVASQEVVLQEAVPEVKETMVKAVSKITVNTYEKRGRDNKSSDATTTNATVPNGRVVRISLPAVDVSRTTRLDTLRDRVESWTAAATNADIVFQECQGTGVQFSARRLNEAGGCTTIKTETTIDTTITGSGITIDPTD